SVKNWRYLIEMGIYDSCREERQANRLETRWGRRVACPAFKGEKTPLPVNTLEPGTNPPGRPDFLIIEVNMLSKGVLLFLAILCRLSAADGVTVVEQIVAKVNGDIITRGELERSRQALEAELKRENLPPAKMKEALKEREADALKDQIDALLLVQKAKELNI